MKHNNKKTGNNQALTGESAETLIEYIIRAGIEALYEIVESEITELCGERYKHICGRVFSRWSKTESEVIMGGRRITIPHSRVRDVQEGRERPLETIVACKRKDLLGDRQLEQVVVGVSTRKYKRSLEGDVGYGTSRSAVSRNFIGATSARLNDWLHRPLVKEYPVLMIDGILFRKVTVVVVMGITEAGEKEVLSFREGSTENARLCTDLVQSLIERGMNPSTVLMATVDGGKGILKALRDIWGVDFLIQRCQLHKKRNVEDYLPQEKRQMARAAMNEAYKAPTFEAARKLLKNLSRKLAEDYPQASRSLEEGLEETLTLLKINAPRELHRSLATTNPIESLMSGIRYTTKRVKRWRNSAMVVRWVFAGIMESQRNFRKINGHRHMKYLIKAVEMYKAKSSGSKNEVA